MNRTEIELMHATRLLLFCCRHGNGASEWERVLRRAERALEAAEAQPLCGDALDDAIYLEFRRLEREEVQARELARMHCTEQEARG